MRNIRGHLYDFAEVYPDEGEMDFLKIMRILRDVQFSGSICPDHMPSHPDDPGKLQAYAFGYGYIKALIHAVNSEVYHPRHLNLAVHHMPPPFNHNTTFRQLVSKS